MIRRQSLKEEGTEKMTRIKSIGKTALRMLTLFAAVSSLSFLLLEMSPIDPMTAYIGTDSTLSAEAREEIRRHWGFHEPPVKRFFKWAENFLHGDWGESITYKKPVKTVIAERFQDSLALMLAAWLFSGVLGYAAGIFAAVRKGRFTDKLIKFFCLTLQSAPAFWIGLLLLSFFAVRLGWFPIGLAAPMGKAAEEVTLADRVYHMILPAFTLSVLGIGKIALYTRQKFIEILSREFILYAKAKGESMGQIVLRHGIRNTLLPAVTVQFASFSELFGGIALAESVFSYPGIGSALTAAGLGGDVPLLLGIAVCSAAFVFAGNLTANLLYLALEPRAGSTAH